MPTPAAARKVLDFWFGDAINDDRAIADRMSVWFGDGGEVDTLIGQQFQELVNSAADRQLQAWQDSARGRLALIILLDQFPRNLYRGTSQAFAHDASALGLCVSGVAAAWLQQLGAIEQVFFLMPMQHSESLPVQERSVSEYEKLLDGLEDHRREYFTGFADYARLHRDIIRRFGRFPHRNAVLGRDNTAAEARYLAGDAPSFGQGK